ncbi:MAG: glycosyltransferase family 32 protein [Dysgonomonas mossii]|uniref:glycosyltransferase family 32 protein n=1 Tax=Dysgonomonas TaxID=156973 RepID=UPI00208E9D37|nr:MULTISPECIES: glycosyltransferase [Dysgonomonas]
MIPKTIHYCWFGRKPLPALAIKCIESWKKYLPDYAIKEWNEDNFNVDIIPYTQEAYNVKKYAYVSDYARFKVLHDEGGIYLDVDVEVLKSLDSLLTNKAFAGFETDTMVAPGLILGAEKEDKLIKDILNRYNNKSFILSDGSFNYETVVVHMTNILVEKGLLLNGKLQTISGLTIYPSDYFSPKSFETDKINITKNTYTIHHYAASWVPRYMQLEKKIWNLLNLKNRYFLARFVAKIKKIKNKI